MGSGDKAYRIALGEGIAMREHQLAMLPIIEQQATMELGIKEEQSKLDLTIAERIFSQEVEQAKQVDLLVKQLQPKDLMPGQSGQVLAKKSVKFDLLVYAVLAYIAYTYLRK